MFSIYRSETAQTPLRQVYEQASPDLQQTILAASEIVNLRLMESPHLEGESRVGNTRILLQAPLGVLFEVDQDQKLVRIIRSWTYDTRQDNRS